MLTTKNLSFCCLGSHCPMICCPQHRCFGYSAVSGQTTIADWTSSSLNVVVRHLCLTAPSKCNGQVWPIRTRHGPYNCVSSEKQ